MVDRIFEVIEDNSSSTGFLIKETVTVKVLELPSICIEEFDLSAKHVRFCDMYKKMSTIRIALAGVTDSLNIVNQTYFDRNSVFNSYGLTGHIKRAFDNTEKMTRNSTEQTQ